MVSVRIASASLAVVLAVFPLVLAQSRDRVLLANPRQLLQDVSAAVKQSPPGDVVPQALTPFTPSTGACFVVSKPTPVFSGGATCNVSGSHQLVGLAPSCAFVRLGNRKCQDADGCLYSTLVDFRNPTEGPVRNFHIKRACNGGPDPLVRCSSAEAAICANTCTVTNSWTGSYYVGTCAKTDPRASLVGQAIVAGPFFNPSLSSCSFCKFPQLVNAAFSQVQNCNAFLFSIGTVGESGFGVKIQCGPVTCELQRPFTRDLPPVSSAKNYVMRKGPFVVGPSVGLNPNTYNLHRITEFGSNIVFSGGFDSPTGNQDPEQRCVPFRLASPDNPEFNNKPVTAGDVIFRDAACFTEMSKWIDQARTKRVRVVGCPITEPCTRAQTCLNPLDLFCFRCGLFNVQPEFKSSFSSVAGVNLVFNF